MIRKALYVGDDFRYWQNIQDFFLKRLDYFEIKFVTLFNPEVSALDLFFTVVSKKPDIVYVDYSSNTAKHLELIKLLSADNSVNNIVVVGLLGIDDRETSMKKAINSGVLFNHLKQAEIGPMVYEPLTILAPEEIKDPDYAFSDLEFKIKASYLAKITKITSNKIDFETSVNFKPKDRFFLKFQVPEKNLKYSGIIIHEPLKFVARSYMSYQFNADFEFVEPRKKDSKQSASEDEQSEALYQEQLSYAQKTFESWIKVQASFLKKSKELRVLIIDKKLDFQSKADLFEHNFSYICQTRFIDPDKEITKFKPDIIFYKFEAEKKLDDEAAKKQIEFQKARDESRKKNKLPVIVHRTNDLSILKEIVSAVKWNNLKTEIYTFNNTFTSNAALKDSISYAQLKPNDKKLTTNFIEDTCEKKYELMKRKKMEHIDQMVKNLKQKDPVKYLKVNRKTFEEHAVQLYLSDSLYHGTVDDTIFLTGLSESILHIASRYPIDHYTVLQVNIPTLMYVTVVPNKMRAKTLKTIKTVFGDFKYTYRCLIHSIDENQRKLLRRCVNAAKTKADEESARLKKEMNIKEQKEEKQTNKQKKS